MGTSNHNGKKRVLYTLMRNTYSRGQNQTELPATVIWSSSDASDEVKMGVRLLKLKTGRDHWEENTNKNILMSMAVPGNDIGTAHTGTRNRKCKRIGFRASRAPHCPSGWIRHNAKCYTVVHCLPGTQCLAKDDIRHCYKLYSKPAVIDSKELDEKIIEVGQDMKLDFVWLGMRKGQPGWPTGYGSYSNWGVTRVIRIGLRGIGKPSVVASLNSVGIYIKNYYSPHLIEKWTNLADDHELFLRPSASPDKAHLKWVQRVGYACEKRLTPPVCKYNWSYYNGSCYLVVRNRDIVWGDARRACLDSEASLAKITAKDMVAYLGLGRRYPERMWVGANDIDKEGRIVWESDGTTLDSGYFEWGDYHFGEIWDCVQISTDGVMYMVSCTDVNKAYGYICERGPEKVYNKYGSKMEPFGSRNNYIGDFDKARTSCWKHEGTESCGVDTDAAIVCHYKGKMYKFLGFPKTDKPPITQTHGYASWYRDTREFYGPVVRAIIQRIEDIQKKQRCKTKKPAVGDESRFTKDGVAKRCEQPYDENAKRKMYSMVRCRCVLQYYGNVAVKVQPATVR